MFKYHFSLIRGTQDLVHELPVSKSFAKLINNANSQTAHQTYRVRSQNLRGVRCMKMYIFNKFPPIHPRDFNVRGSCKPLTSITQPDFHGLDNLRKQRTMGRKSILQSVVKNVPEAE